MANVQMEFPGTWEEYEKDYGFNDSEEVYTNNARLIPSFRVKQWLDHLPSIQPTTKENLVVEDCISRAEAIKALNCKISGSIKSDIDLSKYKREFQEFANMILNAQEKAIQALPPVTPQPKTGHCKDCKYFEYNSMAKVDGIPLIVAHEICKKWGDGCKTNENGYCFLFESQESEVEE